MIKTFLNKILNSKNSRTKAIKQNIAGSLLVKGISIATSLILVPLTLGYVSSEIYGIWLTISSILYWLTYMDVGFTLGLKNRLAEAIAQKDFDRGRSLVSTTYFIMTVIFVPLTVLLLLISPHIDWCAFLNVDIAYQAEVTKTIQILFVFVALQMISNVFIAVVAAFQKVALSSLFNVIGQLFALIIIFIMTRCIPPALPNLAIAYSMMPILVVIVASVIFFKGKFRQVSPTIKVYQRLGRTRSQVLHHTDTNDCTLSGNQHFDFAHRRTECRNPVQHCIQGIERNCNGIQHFPVSSMACIYRCLYTKRLCLDEQHLPQNDICILLFM